MTVKVDHRNWPVGTVNGPQQGQSDGVVAAKGDDAGQGLALLGGASFVGVGGRRS